MKQNISGLTYEAQDIQMYEFVWTDFITENYNSDQKLIVEYQDGDILVIEYSDFMDNQHIERVGVKRYRSINFTE